MDRLTKKTYEQLLPYKVHLIRARAKYVLSCDKKTAEALLVIYKKLHGNKSINTSCGSCILSMNTDLAKVFFEYEEEMAKKAEKQREKEAKVKEEKNKKKGEE